MIPYKKDEAEDLVLKIRHQEAESEVGFLPMSELLHDLYYIYI